MNQKILLTGVSGFLGLHTTIQLLEKGYSVVGTIRDHQRSSRSTNTNSQPEPNAHPGLTWTLEHMNDLTYELDSTPIKLGMEF